MHARSLGGSGGVFVGRETGAAFEVCASVGLHPHGLATRWQVCGSAGGSNVVWHGQVVVT